MLLKSHADRLSKAQSGFAAAVTGGIHRIRYGLVLIGALLAGVGQFIPPATTGVAWNMVVGLIGVGLAFAGGLVTFRIDKEAPAALDEARKAVEAAQESTREAENFRSNIIVELTKLKRQDKQTRQLVALSKILREGVEQALTSRHRPIHEELQSLILTAYRPFLACLHADAGERWTLTVYREVNGLLKSVASCNVDRGEEQLNLREWRSGEGYAGAAHAMDDEVILPDAQSHAVLSVLHVPKEKRNAADSSRYRSIAAVPIRVTGISHPWGVVIATSDQVGRFDSNGGGEAAISTEAVRILSGFIALIAAGEQLRNSIKKEAKSSVGKRAPPVTATKSKSPRSPTEKTKP